MISDDWVIRVEDVTKHYRLGELADVMRRVMRLVGRDTAVEREVPAFAALRDISLSVRAGETLGILGSNGSGKTTLVQLICGISVPTQGRIAVRGCVLPLLEIGAGFHPELTGRENVVLFGAVLGMSVREIETAMDAIFDFAEIGRAHMDTPLKRYSMGMKARLSFAVAMRFPADIYVFDEVMAVVDDHFRAVAHDEIRQLAQAGGTVLFISHDLDSVRSLCDTALWLEGGAMREHGPVEPIADRYEQFQMTGVEAEVAS